MINSQEALKRDFKITWYEDYHWDQETARLVFSDGDDPKVIAAIQFVGSVSTKTNTWLWSWANNSVLEKCWRETIEVKSFGERMGFPKLYTPHWPADEIDGWEMTSICARMLEARGAYRSPKEDGFTFMILMDVCAANEE